MKWKTIGKQILTPKPNNGVFSQGRNDFLFKLFTAKRHRTFRKAREFLPFLTAALNYLNPLVSNALYGSILLFGMGSFKFVITICKSQWKIPNKLLMPYNCTLLSFHSSSLILKARVFFLHRHTNPETQFFVFFCSVALKAFHHLFLKSSHICWKSAGDLERVFLFQSELHDSVDRFWWLL